MRAVPMKIFKPKKPSAPRIDREGLEQAALVKELFFSLPKVAALIYHVPNGGQRHKAVAAKLKEQGVKAGVPDLVLPMARGGYFGLYLEFKATPPNAAPVSPSQHAWLRQLSEQGYLAIVCRGHFDAMEQIRAYLRLPQTVVAA